jgi:beta-lactamase class A
MTSVMPWRAAIGKEIRALAPMWAVAMVALAMSGVLRRAGWGSPANAVFIVGSLALGALSIGHEYQSGTLTLLLSQPVDRGRLFIAKFTALACLLIPLALTNLVVASPGAPFGSRATLALFVLIVGFSLLVAPWMTMIARGPLGGTVFALTAMMAVFVASPMWQRLSDAVFGGDWRWWPSPFLIVCLVGAVLGWRAFMRLEALDGDRDFRMSARAGSVVAAHSVSRRTPFAALALKELQLQQMTFIVSALSLAAIVVLMWSEHRHYEFATGLTYPASILHLVAIPILAGALASAEERSLGTLEWQILQPIAAWKQWATKASVAIGLAVALGVGGLALMRWLDPGGDLVIGYVSGAGLAGSAFLTAMCVALGLSVASLYVSSFSTNALRAALVAVPVIATLIWFGLIVLIPLDARATSFQFLTRIVEPIVERWHYSRFTPSEASRARDVIETVAVSSAIALAGLLLRFGLVNHRTSGSSPRRLIRQAAGVGVWWLVSVLSLGTVSAWYWTGTRNYITVAERARHQRWQESLNRLVAGFDGRIGACISDGSDMPYACVRALDHFPMQSVMKLPVAVAVLDAVDHGMLRLDEPIVVHEEDLSVYVQPIAKLVGPDGFKTTIDDLIRRAIVDSDNAAADILIARLGKPFAVEVTLARKGLWAIETARDEKHLQSAINGIEWKPEYVDPAIFDRAVAAVPPEKRDAAFQTYLHDTRDTATPLAMTRLLDSLDKDDLLRPESRQHLLDILRQTTTMPDRLKAGVPDGWTIGHKTGTSGEWRGVTAATNDVGIITGPKGENIYISVFIAESRASAADRAALIASIARMAIDNYK